MKKCTFYQLVPNFLSNAETLEKVNKQTKQSFTFLHTPHTYALVRSIALPIKCAIMDTIQPYLYNGPYDMKLLRNLLIVN